YSFQVTADGALWQMAGIYEVDVQHGSADKKAKTTFQFSGINNDQPDITLLTDKNSYVDGDTISISGSVKNVTKGNLMTINILNPDSNISDLSQVYVLPDGYYTDTIPIGGQLWTKNGNYTIRAQYGPSLVITKNFIKFAQPIVELDKSVYTWTDRVNITVIAQDQNLDHNKIDTIGNTTFSKIKISTRGNSISSYKLEETGANTGIFTGYVILTGTPAIKGPIGVDGNGTNPTGAGPSGTGPSDGLLPADDDDGIGVSFQTSDQTFVGSALVRWNIGQISWLPSNYTANGRVLQIIDPDMHLNPNSVGTFLTSAWSNSDLAGVIINMTEIEPNTGIFRGTVHFTNDTSSGNILHLSAGNNTVTGEYNDRTLPAPYTTADQFRFNATTNVIGNATVTSPPTVELDKTAYTWTDRVNMTVIAPDQNLDHNKIDTIGNTTFNKITISTRGNSISLYKLVETGLDTGVFTGNVTLTGNPIIKGLGGVDGEGTNPTGLGPSGTGPLDGVLPAQDSDGISVSFQTQNQTVTASAPVRWNIGNVSWLQPSYPANGQGVCQIVD
ncbi:MAG: hypothetical protein ACRD32_05570, partial [Nitrososphaerales archaeon]